MAKKAAVMRVHQLAKQLGVSSKDVVAKCQAEDIPDITNHMSAISVGLSVTVREWFGGGSGASTAVETAAPVDLKKVRKKGSSKTTKATKATKATKKSAASTKKADAPAEVAAPEASAVTADAVVEETVAPEAAPVETSPAVAAEVPVTSAPDEPGDATNDGDSAAPSEPGLNSC